MQGRFKRDGSASAEPEPHGGTDRGSSPQHAQNPGQTPTGDGSGRPGASASSAAPKAAPTSNVVPTVKPAQAPSYAGSRLALRNWRISTRLVSLLALPVVAATSLGALRINENMNDIQQLDNMKLLTDMTKQATELAAALQEERDQSAGPLAHGGLKANDYQIKGYQQKTDRARENFLDASEQIDAASKDGNLQGVRDALVGLANQLDDLAKIRKSAYTSKKNATQTVESYHRLITQLIGLSQDMAEASSNPEMISRTRALAAFSTAKEYASVQRAMIASALPATTDIKGDLSENDRLYGQSAYESEGSELAIFRKIYASQNAEELLKPIDEGNATIEAADTYAKRSFESPDGLQQLPARSYKDWVDDSSTKIEQMKKIEHTLLEEMEQKARELKSATQRDAIISGALILIVLGVSLVGAFVVARSMIRSLRRLQETATKVAQDRLPELVKQLSESDPQDVDTSVESVGVHSRDEIGQVAAAFDDVHREAVRLAAEQALLRGNVNAMFTNLSRRSQGLIQRQLSLISELESREADPDQLSSLFKLDHLATRMRRNGENLLVLAGEEPGRRWTRPVPLVDVLRAAASEVEQYERIELAAVPTTEVAGRVVNDLVHLLAELLENATSFSSPQTKVKVTGHALPDGRVLIEIHDTGIGLSPEDLAAINERLASPPTVDVSVSRRMGLFVVGRLSQRHGIRIQLRPSDSGGTTALVMLPVDVAQGNKKPAPGKPGAPMTSGGPAAAQAAAGAAAARRQTGAKGGGLGAAPAGGGLLGGGPAPRGQVGSAQGPRAALPGAGQGGRPGAPGGARGPQGGPGGPQQNRPAPAGFGGQTPGAPQGLQAAAPGGPQQDAFGGRAPKRSGAPSDQGRQPQLPPRGGPRAELPGGDPQSRTPDWNDGRPPLSRASLDTPRGHDEQDPAQTAHMPRVDDRQGPGSTAEIPRIDAQGPAATGEFPRAELNGASHTGQFARPDDSRQTGQFAQPDQAQQDSGSFVRPDVFGTPAPGLTDNGGRHTGQFPAQQTPQSPQAYDGVYDGGSTGQHALPGRQDPGHTGQFERSQPAGRADFGTPRPPAPQQRPARQEPGSRGAAQRPDAGRGPGDNWALPPASGPGDGRTPLYDTLETNWFHGGQQQDNAPAQQQQQQQPQAPAPQRSASDTGSWRTSPNDELVRQAERVRQPAAGGVTTSGLPRRVPRANLVPGTAQQQQHQSGPQVSRAPDDVRGRLTNLRRGIAQGRQAGSGQTGSFPSPTHQQER
ncbi:nitrate- and nitrite sensing domain-containing protein [Streptomyces tricolor]|uniref:histidine kinase n=1 Tax=Streptomyces tricolor TaxID=68277 RepID=A0ABS9JR57_9ACTN|nr:MULTISPECIES: nitrate- and nitrite sensing domain-containing protein [Streptomyces]MCG0068028.1 nitrate- and nitrite sensing domain-containing protein [Streptomyces tricolor]BCM69705.1 putative sensor-like histidine kinase [Streptomyces sp. EAS-AB2608]